MTVQIGHVPGSTGDVIDALARRFFRERRPGIGDPARRIQDHVEHWRYNRWCNQMTSDGKICSGFSPGAVENCIRPVSLSGPLCYRRRSGSVWTCRVLAIVANRTVTTWDAIER